MDRFRRDGRRHHKIVSVGILVCSLVFIWSIALIAVLYYFFTEIKPVEHVTVNTTNENIWILQRPKPWYMANGTLYPVRTAPDTLARIWPEQAKNNPITRIHNQLMLAPKTIAGMTKVVVFWSHRPPSDIPINHCPVNSCVFTNSRDQAQLADAVVFSDTDKLLQDYPAFYRKRSQIWVFSNMDKPKDYAHPVDIYNWTATYRLDSDLPISKYGYWMYYNQKVKENPMTVNVVGEKNLLVAWFPSSSSCNKTSKSYSFANTLGYYIYVDKYGECSDVKCPQNREEVCFRILREKYKFYLAFEDEYCDGYVPDKFYLALQSNTIPIVMGLPRSFYESIAPENSFIHVDDFNSTHDLVSHLYRIGRDDKLFNSYFSWQGTGEFINGWYCRLCALLHSDYPNRMIRDINDWWLPDGVCKK